jgi:hypothetical protein
MNNNYQERWSLGNANQDDWLDVLTGLEETILTVTI